MVYQHINFKFSLFGWKDNILYKQHIVHWWLGHKAFPFKGFTSDFPRSEYHYVVAGGRHHRTHTHQKDWTTFDTIALFSPCLYMCKGHALPLLCLCTIFDSCKISSDTDQTKIQSCSSGSREPGTTHILTGGRTQFPALYCCTAISQTRVLLRSCKLFAFSKSLIA